MTAPALTEKPETSVATLITVLRLRGVSAVPIVRGEELVGIVSTTDILRAESAASAADLMSTPVLTVEADEPLDEAARRLAAGRVHRLVVLERGRVAGILSARDILEEVKKRRVLAPLSTVMSSPVATVDLGTPTEDAVKELAAANVHGLVVVDGEAPVGVFTHAEALAARRLPPELRRGPVEQVMSYETICLDAATPIHRAAAYATSMNVRRFLVTEHRRLVGIVSGVDLVDVLSRAADA